VCSNESLAAPCRRVPVNSDVIRHHTAAVDWRFRLLNPIREYLPSFTGTAGSAAAYCMLVLGPMAALAGALELLLLVLLGKVPESPLGTWSLMSAMAVTVAFVVWNMGHAARIRAKELLRPLTASVAVWAVPFLLATLNAILWWGEGVEAVLGRTLLVFGAAAALVSLPIASWQVLEHATKHPTQKRTSYYILEAQAGSGEWQVIAEIDDDVLELNRVQDNAFGDQKWSALRLTVEDRSRRVVQRHRRSNYWEHINLLANGKPDDGVGKAV
jgi:hypothetical protein